MCLGVLLERIKLYNGKAEIMTETDVPHWIKYFNHELPEHLVMRCLVSKNPCGTDTHMVGQPCQCENCKNAQVYSCEDCGKMRSQNEGGTVFTVCDECWDNHFGEQVIKNVR